ncbi:MAG: YeeE/YedE family protein, partial [Gammaproteobacteria bacterium]|nr:YeeE/YedE family protein [Gammaproteobacteria bacterium]
MVFENFAAAQGYFLWGTFAIALVLGVVANKTNFCTMGAVSDWVNIGDTGRMRAWLFAIAVAVLGV